jgi:hypothetical protein
VPRMLGIAEPGEEVADGVREVGHNEGDCQTELVEVTMTIF